MAYSKAPIQSTYDTKRVNILENPSQRGASASYDYSLVNMMVDVVEMPATGQKKIFVKNRPGLTTRSVSANTGEGRGIFYWETYTALIHVVGNKVYFNNSVLITLTTSTGSVGIAEHVDQDALHTLILLDGVQGYVIYVSATIPGYKPIIPTTWQASTAYAVGASVSPVTVNGYAYDCTVAGTTASTQPTWPTTVGATVTNGTVTWKCREMAFPTPHVPAPIFLDGYVFVAKKGTQDIYNCDLNYPFQWSAGNYVTAEMYPDQIVGLSKNNNMIYGVGSQSIQYFYDAANPTGTPLLNNPGTVQQFGSPAPDTIVQTEEDVILVGSTQNGGRTVWKLNGFKAKDISIPAVCQALDAEGSAITTANGTCIRTMGQKLYVLILSNTTWVYCFDTDMWSMWSGVSGNFRATHSTATGSTDANSIWIDKSNGKVYTMTNDVYTDDGQAYPCTLVTSKMDFDIINRKLMHRFSLIADIADTAVTSQAFSVSWTDDDYRTFTTPRTLTMNGDLPSLKQLGDFRRRAFKITYTGGAKIRLEGIEVDINKGIR